MKAILVRTDDSAEVVDIPQSSTFTYFDKHFGGFFEIVRPRRLPPSICMIVDESGLLKSLPVNNIGSYLYQTDLHGNPIVGDVFILKEIEGDDGRDLAGLSEEDIADLSKKLKLSI